jgi:uncharacterized protein
MSADGAGRKHVRTVPEMVLTPNVREQLRAASTDSAPSHSGNIATLHAHEPELRHQSIHHAALFGSVVRGEARPSSDIDLLIDLNPEAPIGFFKYVELTGFIGGLFPVRVDIANRARIKPYVRPSITVAALGQPPC